MRRVYCYGMAAATFMLLVVMFSQLHEHAILTDAEAGAIVFVMSMMVLLTLAEVTSTISRKAIGLAEIDVLPVSAHLLSVSVVAGFVALGYTGVPDDYALRGARLGVACGFIGALPILLRTEPVPEFVEELGERVESLKEEVAG